MSAGGGAGEGRRREAGGRRMNGTEEGRVGVEKGNRRNRRGVEGRKRGRSGTLCIFIWASVSFRGGARLVEATRLTFTTGENAGCSSGCCDR